jgi:4-hydroxybenzoate polyprenyltransferase
MLSTDSKASPINNPVVKLLALLSIVRWYNILLIAISLYLTEIFIFNKDTSLFITIQHPEIHFYTLSIVFITMGGYLINAFYDFEKDLINHPETTYFGRIVSKKTCLNTYVFFTILGILIGALISKKILLFNALLAMGLWLYSHKLRKKPLTGELSATFLTVSSFIGLYVFNNLQPNKTLILFVTYLFTIDLTREIIKKMVSLKGDLIVGEKSIPILFGIKFTKYIIFSQMIFSLLAIFTLLPSIIEKNIAYYFLLAIVIIVFSIFLLRKSKNPSQFNKINSVYKVLLLLAIFSIMLY